MVSLKKCGTQPGKTDLPNTLVHLEARQILKSSSARRNWTANEFSFMEYWVDIPHFLVLWLWLSLHYFLAPQIVEGATNHRCFQMPFSRRTIIYLSTGNIDGNLVTMTSTQGGNFCSSIYVFSICNGGETWKTWNGSRDNHGDVKVLLVT